MNQSLKKLFALVALITISYSICNSCAPGYVLAGGKCETCDFVNGYVESEI